MSPIIIILSIFGLLSLFSSVLVLSAMVLSSRTRHIVEGPDEVDYYIQESDTRPAPNLRKETAPAP
jgi:hypothetical protein